MAFPNVAASATSTTTGALQEPTMPTHSDGQMLVAWSTVPSDFKGQVADNAALEALDRWEIESGAAIAVYWKIANGASEQLSITRDSAQDAVWIVTAINNADGIFVGATNANNPPNVTTDAARDYLWLAAMSNADGGATVPTAPPTNYSGMVTSTGFTNQHLAYATRELNAVSEDPGAFTVATLFNARGWTIAVYQKSAGTREFTNRIHWKDNAGGALVSVGKNSSTTTGNVNDFTFVDNAFSIKVTNGDFIQDPFFNDKTNGYRVSCNSGSATGHVQWEGNGLDFGARPGNTIIAITKATIFYRVITNTAGFNDFAFADLVGSGGALELITDPTGSPTSHVLMPDQADFVGTSNDLNPLSIVDSTGVTGLSIADTDLLQLKIHTVVDNPTGVSSVHIVRVVIEFTVAVPAPATVDAQLLLGIS